MIRVRATVRPRILALILLVSGVARGQAPPSTAAADALFKKGDYAGAAAAYEALAPAPIPMFNAACAWVRAGDKERALAVLERAVAGGFRLLKLLETDEDLAAIRSEPRFQKLLATVRERLHPCGSRPESRQLDFWIGEWNVLDASGQPVGSSRVELVLESCVVLESWTGRGGGSGKSFNAWDPQSRTWQQFWVDDSGTLTHYTGELRDGALRYQTAPDGSRVRRLTFSRLDSGRVRQLAERSTDGGKSWATTFDFTYVKKG